MDERANYCMNYWAARSVVRMMMLSVARNSWSPSSPTSRAIPACPMPRHRQLRIRSEHGIRRVCWLLTAGIIGR